MQLPSGHIYYIKWFIYFKCLRNLVTAHILLTPFFYFTPDYASAILQTEDCHKNRLGQNLAYAFESLLWGNAVQRENLAGTDLRLLPLSLSSLTHSHYIQVSISKLVLILGCISFYPSQCQTSCPATFPILQTFWCLSEEIRQKILPKTLPLLKCTSDYSLH